MSAQSLVAIRETPIDVSELLEFVSMPSAGATSCFIGTVRDNNNGHEVTGISYEAYGPMALEEMQRIANEVQSTHSGVTVAIIHRIGQLNIGDISIAVVTSHARRSHSIEATREIIEEIKARVPIWKLEHYVKGDSEWINPVNK